MARLLRKRFPGGLVYDMIYTGSCTTSHGSRYILGSVSDLHDLDRDLGLI